MVMIKMDKNEQILYAYVRDYMEEDTTDDGFIFNAFELGFTTVVFDDEATDYMHQHEDAFSDIKEAAAYIIMQDLMSLTLTDLAEQYNAGDYREAYGFSGPADMVAYFNCNVTNGDETKPLKPLATH